MPQRKALSVYMYIYLKILSIILKGQRLDNMRVFKKMGHTENYGYNKTNFRENIPVDI